MRLATLSAVAGIVGTALALLVFLSGRDSALSFFTGQSQQQADIDRLSGAEGVRIAAMSINDPIAKDAAAWTVVNQTEGAEARMEALEEYRRLFPNGAYAADAQQIIERHEQSQRLIESLDAYIEGNK